MTKKRYILSVLILGSLTAIGPFSIDMYLPGFAAIAKSFHTTTAQVSLSLSSFFIGISLGQLLYGPLLDRFGRKKPLYVGLLLYIATSIGCYFSNSIENLIILRFIQAIGSCAAGVASMAMVRDIFPLKDNAKIFALLILILGVSPMVAPTVGGYVTAAFGWQLIFLILASIAIIVLLAVIFGLPESYQPDPNFSLKPKPILNNFLLVVKHPSFYTFSICGALAFSGLFAYLAASPFVFMTVFGLSAKVYGWIFAFLSVGFIGSSQLNTFLIKNFSSIQIIRGALTAMLIISGTFLIGSLNGWINVYTTILSVFLLLCCVGIANPNTSALSLAPFAKNAGTAASLLGAFQMAAGSISSLMVGLFKSQSTIPMAGIMFVSALSSFLIFLYGSKVALKQESKNELQA